MSETTADQLTGHSPVSFVVPAYNCEHTVEAAIESIVRGNFEPDDELVIVNDASLDGTAQVLGRLQEKYPFIQIITNAVNRGCPATRNFGISQARHELLFNLDSDDMLVPGARAQLQRALVAHSADVAAHAESHFFRSTEEGITHRWICPSGFLRLSDYLSSHIVPGGNYLYTRASWKRVGGYDEYGGFLEFWGFGLKQVASGSRFFVVENTHYLHRFGHQSLWARESKEQDASSKMATRMMTPFLDLLDEKDAEYITSEEGSRRWLISFGEHPVKVRTGETGRPGREVVLQPEVLAPAPSDHKAKAWRWLGAAVPRSLKRAIKEHLAGFRERRVRWKLRRLRARMFAVPPRSSGIERCAGFEVSITDGPNFYMQLKDEFVNRIYQFDAQRPDPLIIDGGGNMGMSVLFFKSIYPAARVVAFEPDPRIFRLLEHNIQRNGLHDVQLVNVGLGERAGVVGFTPDGTSGGHFATSGDAATVQVETLSTYLREPVDFLKLNIEGQELPVLREAEASGLLSNVRELVVEYHGWSNTEQRLGAILELLDRAGFRYVVHDFDQETSGTSKPPFRVTPETVWFCLVYAKRIEA